MAKALTISSTQSDRRLVFSDFDGEDFEVTLQGTVTCRTKVYGYSPHSENLKQWLSKLAARKGPWEHELHWSSLESEIELVATCSSLGQVRFEVSFSLDAGKDEESRIDTVICTELGQLAKIGREAERFFTKP
ncbi:MAG: DUF6228 family protein [Pseudomonadota bacterium]